MKIEYVDISTLKSNPANPRTIKKAQLEKLKKSIKDFPEMLELRPIVIDANNEVLGGNMRLKALKELNINQVPVVKITELDDDKKRQFIIKDNVGYGDWDWDMLNADWDLNELKDWGLDVAEFKITDDEVEETPYSTKVQAPIYVPSENEPSLTDTYDDTTYKKFIKQIDETDIDNDMKEYLKICATRHIQFNYEKIADLYAHQNKEIQELMETLALVIIDFDKAIELGYIKLGDDLMEQYKDAYDEK